MCGGGLRISDGARIVPHACSACMVCGTAVVWTLAFGHMYASPKGHHYYHHHHLHHHHHHHHHLRRRHFGSRGGSSWPRIALAWAPPGSSFCKLLYYCVSPEGRQEYLSYVTTFWISGAYSCTTSMLSVLDSSVTAKQYAKKKGARIYPIAKVCILSIPACTLSAHFAGLVYDGVSSHLRRSGRTSYRGLSVRGKMYLSRAPTSWPWETVSRTTWPWPFRRTG